MALIDFNSINEEFYHKITEICKKDMSSQLKNLSVANNERTVYSQLTIKQLRIDNIKAFSNGYKKYIQNREASNYNLKTNYQQDNEMIKAEEEAAIIIYKLNIFFEDNSIFISNLLGLCAFFFKTTNTNEIKSILCDENNQLIRNEIVAKLANIYPYIDVELINYKIDEILRFHINPIDVEYKKVI